MEFSALQLILAFPCICADKKARRRERETNRLHGKSDDVNVVLEGSTVEHGVAIAILGVGTAWFMLKEGLHHTA